MIYSFLRSLIRIALKVYFRKFHIKGQENIPQEGPFLIVANHPSSFLDPMSIAVLVPQKISFLAKATMFNYKIIAWILKGLNLVPIYRAADNPGMVSKNQEMFKSCYQKLSNDGVIMIFPEGTSENERKLRKIKTGAARIALGTAKETNFDVNVKILPVGLNYTKSSTFRSELFLEFGKPIEAKDYFDAFKNDEKEAAKKLTDEIEKSIIDLIINIEEDEYEVLVKQVESLLNYSSSNNADNPFETIEISQNIYAAIEYYRKNDQKQFNHIKKKIDNYFRNLEAINLSDKMIADGVERKNFWNYIFKSLIILIFGFPFWLFGYINSFIPYKIPRYLALLITKSEAFYGALLMSIGTFSFIFFYSFILYWVAKYSGSNIITISYAIALPLCGLFTMFYARVARKFYYNWKFVACFFSKQKLVIQLASTRNGIIKELNRLQDNMPRIE